MEEFVERVLIPTAEIYQRLDELAQQIRKDFQDKELTVVAVLNGSLIFAADLLRRLPLPLKLDCISASSYHGGIESSGTVNLANLPDINGRHVLILEDILDTGLTLTAIQEELGKLCPLSLRVCVLLRKRKRRAHLVTADYIGFDIEDEFVIGYGLDYQEKYRNLPYIGILKESAREE